jgi:branched-chain amino acid transport system ATP-binding protein
VRSVTKRFGGLTALDEVTFGVRPGETLGVIGPNGAGKTTLLDVISGLSAPDDGEVEYRGTTITGKGFRVVAAHGIVRTFQLTAVFPELTVLENIEVSCHLRDRPSFVHELLSSSRARRAAAEERRLAGEIAASVGLGAHADVLASALPYGLKKALSLGIALATDPRIVLLDEPVVGMNDAEIELMVGNISQLGGRGLTVIVVEHNVPFIMDVCERLLVLDFGRVVAEGPPEEVRRDPAVVDAYLGVDT